MWHVHLRKTLDSTLERYPLEPVALDIPSLGKPGFIGTTLRDGFNLALLAFPDPDMHNLWVTNGDGRGSGVYHWDTMRFTVDADEVLSRVSYETALNHARVIPGDFCGFSQCPVPMYPESGIHQTAEECEAFMQGLDGHCYDKDQHHPFQSTKDLLYLALCVAIAGDINGAG